LNALESCAVLVNQAAITNTLYEETRVCARVWSVTCHEVIRAAMMGTECRQKLY